MRKYVRSARYYAWIVYALLWGVVWTYPLLAALLEVARGSGVFAWSGVLLAWRGIVPFFLLFLLHRVPVQCLFLRRRTWAYVFAVAGLLVLFGVSRYYVDARRHRRVPPPVTDVAHPSPPRRDADGVRRPDGAREAFTAPPEGELQPRGGADAPAFRRARPGRRHPAGMPGMLTLDLIIAVLMMGFDLAVALFARYQEEEEKARRLEATHLQHELEYLKAQIHPHFFMNMLNNIHAMVEIDPARAQKMIMELSRLMRYVLYEGAAERTPLRVEAEFIEGYVNLMRERYVSGKVRVELRLPAADEMAAVRVPPLLFISIIENAFKHGISYQRPSFVEIALTVSAGSVCLDCRNSFHPRPASSGRGVGLSNLRQRLALLYADRFSLRTETVGDTYHVTLTIPRETT